MQENQLLAEVQAALTAERKHLAQLREEARRDSQEIARLTQQVEGGGQPLRMWAPGFATEM